MNEHFEYLPIKVVIPSVGDIHRPRGTKAVPKDFTDNYDEALGSVLADLEGVASYFENSFLQSNLPVVARVTLREEAIAKSHRPDKLFDFTTCPIIGGEYFGNLLISIRPGALDKLIQKIQTGSAQYIRNDVSKITSISPFRAQDALGSWSADAILAYMREHGQESLKLRLFDHRDPDASNKLFQHLKNLAASLNVPPPKRLPHCARMPVFDFSANTLQQIQNASGFVGTQGLAVYEDFTISTNAIVCGPFNEDHIPPPDTDVDYPIVGLLDSGTDRNNTQIQKWVIARDDCDYNAVDQNNEHGTLVASLLINAKDLNHGHDGFPGSKAKIVDVVAFPGAGHIDERELLDNIDRGLSNHPDVKIWNMSLNKGSPCHDSAFSYFAVALDEIQDKHGALIVNSAGNYSEHPAPTWPRPELYGRDRIYQPGESLRALTVGSLAHRDRPDACVRIGEPSPFSRRGPGTAFVPKPELSHFGGNTNSNYDYAQMGVRSINAKKQIVETVGTSFAAPLVTVTASALRHRLDGDPSRHLIKGLLVHSAVLNSKRIDANDLHYYGFGTPPDMPNILRCKPWEATLIFEMDLPYTHRHFHKTDFPIPPCLHRNGKVFGEIVMTVSYDPPVDPGEGAAYSQVNIKPSIGRCKGDNGEIDLFKGQVVPYPKDMSQLFEADQISHGFKWAPIKVFRTTMKNVEAWDNWQISIKMEARNHHEAIHPQPVAVIVTLRDPNEEQPVYDQVVTMMNRVGWQTENLQIRTPSRLRVR
jgi:hypothetical protein